MTAARRWRDLVRARLEESARLSPDRLLSSTFWDKDATSGSRRFEPASARDPFLRILGRVTTSDSTVIDVGAGPGRFAIPLAERVRGVVALDQSRPMLDVLARRAAERSLHNVTCQVGRWEESTVEPADLAFSAFVLTLVEDAPEFLRRLDAAARQRVFLYLGGSDPNWLWDAFWRRFHGSRRRPGPTWLDAIDVLEEIGIRPRVRVVAMNYLGRYLSLDEATNDIGRSLAIPASAEAAAELRSLLKPWLVRRAGHLAPPVRTVPGVVLDWRPGGHR